MPLVCMVVINIYQKYMLVILACIFDFYILTATIPIKNPNMFPIADILPLYRLFASGISSPVTIYNIAPAANDKHSDIIVFEIDPIMLPKNAPIPVVIPDKITYIITFPELIPPFFIGAAIEIPSGISCIAIVIAREYPKFK